MTPYIKGARPAPGGRSIPNLTLANCGPQPQRVLFGEAGQENGIRGGFPCIPYQTDFVLTAFHVKHYTHNKGEDTIC